MIKRTLLSLLMIPCLSHAVPVVRVEKEVIGNSETYWIGELSNKDLSLQEFDSRWTLDQASEGYVLRVSRYPGSEGGVKKMDYLKVSRGCPSESFAAKYSSLWLMPQPNEDIFAQVKAVYDNMNNAQGIKSSALPDTHKKTIVEKYTKAFGFGFGYRWRDRATSKLLVQASRNSDGMCSSGYSLETLQRLGARYQDGTPFPPGLFFDRLEEMYNLQEREKEANKE